MRDIIVVLCTLAVLTGCGLYNSDSRINGNIAEFKGLQLPAKEDEVKARFPHATCRNLPIAEFAGAPLVRNCTDSANSIAGITAKIIFVFGMNRTTCEEIHVHFSKASYDTVVASLKKKYGEPNVLEVPTLKTLTWISKDELRSIDASNLMDYASVTFRYRVDLDKETIKRAVKDL